MKTHYSCAELAAMKLPGYPGSVEGWSKLVTREAWEGQKRAGRGGGMEYRPPAKIAIWPAMEAGGTGAEVTLTLTVSLAEAAYITRWLAKKARA